MAKNRLAKLLLEDTVAERSNGKSITKFGIDNITNVHEMLSQRLYEWDNNIVDYDPLFEIAKLGVMTEDDNLKFKCHTELARFKYPQIRSLEIQNKEDREVTITVQLADYAQPRTIEVEAEEVEVEGDLEAETEHSDYASYVLGKTKEEDKL